MASTQFDCNEFISKLLEWSNQASIWVSFAAQHKNVLRDKNFANIYVAIHYILSKKEMAKWVYSVQIAMIG